MRRSLPLGILMLILLAIGGIIFWFSTETPFDRRSATVLAGDDP